MEFAKGQIVSVSRTLAGGTLVAAASASDTTLFLDDVRYFDEDGGSLTVDGVTMAYTAVDQDAQSLTVPALASGIATDTFVAVSPEAPVHTAFVLLDDDSAGDPIPARVPLDKRALLPEGPRAPEDMEAATLQFDGDEWTLMDWEFKHGSHDATTTPIVVTTEDGESVRIDGDGLTTYTNDPILMRVIVGTFSTLATDGGFLYATQNTDIYKIDPATGVEDTSGFPIVGTYFSIAADGGFIFARDGSNDIRKYDATTGVENLSGFPIVGSYLQLEAAAGFVYCTDSSFDLRRFDGATGTEDVTGFPIVGSFSELTANDTHIFALESGDIRKFDAATGVEDTSGFPIVGTYGSLDVRNGVLYATSATGIQKFDATTGIEVADGGFPIVGTYANPTSDDSYLYAVGPANDIYLFNLSSGARSLRIDSSTGLLESVGSLEMPSITTGVANADRLTVSGPASVDNLLVTTTKARKTATQSTATATEETLGQSGETYGAFDGSGTSGDTAFWTESDGVFTILVPGVYEAHAFVEWAANVTGIRVAKIRVNSTKVAEDSRPAASATTETACAFGTGKIYLGLGATVDLRVLQNSGGNLNVAIGSYLSITRVGALAA